MTNKPDCLTEALRQYQHNDGSGLVFGYDIETVDRISAADKARIAELEQALSECAASLAWNCFGECRAIHAGPIMPAAQALETAREALATHQKREGE